ncbi:MAG: DUF1273 domain-containing protein [Ruminococcaceae bacterium]|nr:DUF1273 domain-containing protein [Oscillospiraceae bacterium]
MICAIFGENPDELAFGYDEDYPTCTEMKFRLVTAMQALIGEGCSCFASTLEQGAAMWGAEVCDAIRGLGGTVRFIAAPMSEEQASRWHPERRERYFHLLEMADELISPMAETAGEEYLLQNADAILMLGDTANPRLADIADRAEKGGIRVIIA